MPSHPSGLKQIKHALKMSLRQNPNVCGVCGPGNQSAPQRSQSSEFSNGIRRLHCDGVRRRGGAQHCPAHALTKAQRDKLGPGNILALMKKGNKRVYAGKREDRDVLAQHRASAKGQYQRRFSLLVSTRGLLLRRSWTSASATSSTAAWQAMSRIQTSLAVWNLPVNWRAKVVLVMGHTACGAIKGAIDNAELGNLTGLLATIKPAAAATLYTGERTSKNYPFVDAVARKNVELTMVDIREDNPVLAEIESNGTIKVAGVRRTIWKQG
jgi:carbonic anhydrase